jgi:hypothetical protein
MGVQMKISREAFLEQIEHDFAGTIPANVEAVPCDCNMPYCEGWRLTMKGNKEEEGKEEEQE